MNHIILGLGPHFRVLVFVIWGPPHHLQFSRPLTSPCHMGEMLCVFFITFCFIPCTCTLCSLTFHYKLRRYKQIYVNLISIFLVCCSWLFNVFYFLLLNLFVSCASIILIRFWYKLCMSSFVKLLWLLLEKKQDENEKLKWNWSVLRFRTIYTVMQ